MSYLVKEKLKEIKSDRLIVLAEHLSKIEKVLVYQIQAKYFSIFIFKIKDDFVIYRIFKKWDVNKKEVYGEHIIIKDYTFNDNNYSNRYNGVFDLVDAIRHGEMDDMGIDGDF